MRACKTLHACSPLTTTTTHTHPPPLPLCRADTDGTGRLNCVQLMAMLEKLGREMSLDDADRLIRVINQNGAAGWGKLGIHSKLVRLSNSCSSSGPA